MLITNYFIFVRFYISTKTSNFESETKQLEEKTNKFQDEIIAYDPLGDVIMKDLEESKVIELDIHGQEVINNKGEFGLILSKSLIELPT